MTTHKRISAGYTDISNLPSNVQPPAEQFELQLYLSSTGKTQGHFEMGRRDAERLCNLLAEALGYMVMKPTEHVIKFDSALTAPIAARMEKPVRKRLGIC